MCRDDNGYSYIENKAKLLEVLENFSGGPDLEENCIDAITTILHYAQVNGLNVPVILPICKIHFNTETGESI